MKEEICPLQYQCPWIQTSELKALEFFKSDKKLSKKVLENYPL
jgi:hypothetical protein